MQQIVFTSEQPRFTWIDVTAPTPSELEALALEHGLHPNSVQDCLDPQHLPKHERIEAMTFVIVRAFDETAGSTAETTQQISRKVAIFMREGLVLTIHRKEQSFLEEVKRRLTKEDGGKAASPGATLYALLDAVLDTYWRPLEDAERAIAHFEQHLFAGKDLTETLHEIYRVKRRVTVIRWMARHTLEVIQKLRDPALANGPAQQDLREHAESLYFAGDELFEDANNLLNMQLALASHRTSEVMRVLTLFSVFFMPLTFIVGIYGMNFEFMPELKMRGGYPATLLFMLATSGVIWLWFHRKGWL